MNETLERPIITNISPQENNPSDSSKTEIPQSVEQVQLQQGQEKMVKIIKIHDGKYIGDKYLSYNPNFMIPYKISHVINASGEKFEFHVENFSYKILNITWEDSADQVLIDKEDSIPNEIQKFIDECEEIGEGLLVYSVKGQNRACIIYIIYFMKKYNWSLQKCIEFMKININS